MRTSPILPAAIFLLAAAAASADPLVLTTAEGNFPLDVSAGYVILHGAAEGAGDPLPERIELAVPGHGRLELRDPVDWNPQFGIRIYQAREGDLAASVATVRAVAPVAALRPGVVLATPLFLLRGAPVFIGPRLLARLPAGSGRAGAERLGAEYGLVLEGALREDLETWIFRMPGRDGVALLETAEALDRDPRAVWATVDRFTERRPAAPPPDDPRYGQQWHLNNPTGTCGNPDMDVNAPEAWNVWTGHADSAILVIDNGVMGTHLDLTRNIWINPGEIPASKGIVDTDGDGVITFDDLNAPANAGKVSDRNGNGFIDPIDLTDNTAPNVGLEDGLDNDGNGYVDDVTGIQLTGTGYRVDPYNPVWHCNGGDHGTPVAGVAAARGWNARDGLGACPHCRIAGTSAIDCIGFPDSTFVQLFYYAADNGFLSTNNSWGPGPDPSPLSQVFRDCYEYSWSQGRGGRGTIHYFASGNSHPETVDTDGYAAYSRVFAIGASTDTGVKAGYSEEGLTLDFCAPSNGGQCGIATTTAGGGWTADFGGTSSACPLACGVGSLLVSSMPAMKPDKAYDLLRKTAMKIDTGYDGNGFSRKYGYGMVRAGEALARTAPGSVLTDKANYACAGEAAVLSVRDATGQGTVTARFASTTEPAGEPVVCTEVPGRPGLYEGTVQTSPALPPVPGDGMVTIQDRDILYAYYPQGEIVEDDTATANCSSGCGAIPEFGGLVSVTDNSPCYADGILITWVPVSNWGDATGGSYNVYRSQVPGFIPSDSSRIQSGVTASFFVDLSVAPDTTYYYVVRALNNRTDCFSPPTNGVEDSNTVEGSASDGSLPRPAFAGAEAAADLDPCFPSGVRITWSPATGGGTGNVAWYNVYRSEIPAFVPDSSNYLGSVDASATEYTDPVLPSSNTYYYIVRAENDVPGCGGQHGGIEDLNFAEVSVRDDRVNPPFFAGLVSVTDPDQCAGGQLDLAWNAVSTWGPGGPGNYDIYRAETTPVPVDAANLAGSVPAGTHAWSDTTTVPGVTYHYLVKAESGTTLCSGTPHGGRMDDNTVEASSGDTWVPVPDLPGDVRVEKLPDRTIRVWWDPVAGASHVNLYRGTFSFGAFSYNHICYKPELIAGEWIETVPTPVGKRGLYFMITGENFCGETELPPDSSGNPIPYRVQCL